ncbi:ATP-binding protein [Actinocorallia longicatena]|uniref:Histidine kinase/HSP90-like ATPase domain-containing protein n=1 Tax=Actinocorallia longicatena TaxID=111803 RepID=A0ABP6QMB7_9ACTN
MVSQRLIAIVRAVIRDREGPWMAEQDFAAIPEAVTDIRSWASALVAEGCIPRDDLLIVVSELVGNIVEHGNEGGITFTLSHSGEGLVASIVHHAPPPEDVPDIPLGIAAEIGGLFALGDERPDDGLIAGLSENGRGLFTVAVLTGGSMKISHDPDRTVLRWVHGDCRCKVRAQ